MVRSVKQAQDEVERLYDIVLREREPFPGADANEKAANVILAEMKAAAESGDAKLVVKSMMLKDNLKTAIIRMIYDEEDASMIPMAYLKHCLMYPLTPVGFPNKEQRNSIDGPTRAIRVFCMECQGQSAPGVRECAASNCTFWSFRMGTNPFYGRLVGAEDESVETDAEIEALEASRAQTPAEAIANGNT